MNKLALILVALFLFSTSSVSAQDKVSKKEVKNIIKTLSDKQARDAVNYARTLYKEDSRKELESILKQMDDNQTKLLFDYLELVNKYAAKKEEEERKKKEQAKPSRKYAEMTFDATSFDFGPIEQGEKVSHTYKFTNTGSKALEIMTIKSSCGCAVPNWPKEKIEPGETGEISIQFDSAGKLGVQSKRVTIYANTSPQSTFLFIAGEVMKKRE